LGRKGHWPCLDFCRDFLELEMGDIKIRQKCCCKLFISGMHSAVEINVSSKEPVLEGWTAG